MLSNSRNILITGGTFVENHHHISQYSHMMGLDPREKAWEKLLQNITPGAFHNSAERYDPPKCHPGTRKVILNKLMNWLKDPGNRRLFIWLYGPAGSGKSAIAQTIAEMCYQAGILAASFFFSRAAPGRNDDKFLISTLSYQLCILIPELRTYVGEAIDRDPSIYTRSLATQMQELIVNPLNRATQKKDVMARLRSRPMVIIIDGLDECGHGPSQRHILNTLSSSIHQLSIPLPFIISSRPEFDIRQAFNSQTLRSMMVGLALDDTYRPGDDIRVFLLSKFSEIRTDHPLRMYLPLDWPREPDLRYLVEKSSGQFIYASTVAKFVESHRHRPEERLRVVLGLSHPNDDRPFAVLDTLYRQILLSADNVEKVLEVLTFILLDFALPTRRQISSWNMNSPRISPAGIEDNLGYRRGDMSIILCDLHAILKFPVHERDALSLYHASLGDFLLDRSRSNNLFIDAETGHAYLARKCMQHISRSPGVSSQYDVQYIVGHCIRSRLTQELLNDLYGFNFEQCLTNEVEMYEWDVVLRYFQTFLDWLVGEHDLDPRNELYQHCFDRYNGWLRSQFSRYPPSFRGPLSAALTFTGFFNTHEDKLFDILTFNMTPDQIYTVEWADQQLFRFRNSSRLGKPGQFSRTRDLSLINDFLLDARRAGADCVDGNKYAVLAHRMARFLFGVPTSDTDSVSPSEKSLHSEQVALQFLPLILPKASKVPHTAEYLRDHALQFRSTDQFQVLRESAALASLEYIQRCGIPLRGHGHIPYHDTVCVLCRS